MKPFALLAASLSLVATFAAQNTTMPPRQPNEGAPRHVVGIDVFPTPGRPFSGRDCIDITSHIENASDQTTHLDGALVARDSRGRVYREIRIWFPSSSGPQSRLDYIILLDPVAHTRTECKIAALLHNRSSRSSLQQ